MKNRSSTQGFTIIELIVVVVIIAILATVASFGFSSWRKRTDTTVIKNDLIALKTAMKNEKNFSSGYPTSLPSSFKSNPNVTVTYVSGDAGSYCINAVSKTDSSLQFYIDSSGNSSPQSGACTVATAPVSTPPAAPSGAPTVTSSSTTSTSGTVTYTIKAGGSTCVTGLSKEWNIIVKTSSTAPTSTDWAGGTWSTSAQKNYTPPNYGTTPDGTVPTYQYYAFAKPRCVDTTSGLSTEYNGYATAAL